MSRLVLLLPCLLVGCGAPPASDGRAPSPPPEPASIAQLVLLEVERDDEYDRLAYRLDNTSQVTVRVLSSCGSLSDACSAACSGPGRPQFTQPWTQRWHGSAYGLAEAQTLLCGNGMRMHPVPPGESFWLFDLVRPEEYPCRRGVRAEWGDTGNPWRFERAQVVWGPRLTDRPAPRE